MEIVIFTKVLDLLWFLEQRKVIKSNINYYYSHLQTPSEREIEFNSSTYGVDEFISFLKNISVISIITVEEYQCYETIKKNLESEEGAAGISKGKILLNYSLLVKAEICDAFRSIQDNRLLSIKEACHLLGVSRKTLYRWTKDNYLPYFDLNGILKFRYCEILDYIEKYRRN